MDAGCLERGGGGNNELLLGRTSALIDELCKSDDPSAAERAEKILRDLEKGGGEAVVHCDDYTNVIKCYIRHNQVERAHNLLVSQSPGNHCRPSIQGFSLVADAWIRRNQLGKARKLLNDYMDRGIAVTLCFNTIISPLVKRNKRVVHLLHTMDEYARNGHPEARPDKVTMSCIMQFMANRGDALQAHALLERMWSSPDPRMHPDAVAYSLVFKAYANARHCMPNKAHALLQTMKDRYNDAPREKMSIQPNTVVHNSFLSVLARAGDGERAEQVLKEMESFASSSSSSSTDLQPDAISYGTVLTAWKNASRGDKAEALLRRMPNPDRTCFSITIAALAKQGYAKRAEDVFELMLSRSLKPTTAMYTALINAWANCKDDIDSFEHVKRIMQEMGSRTDLEVDTPVWNTFLKAIENAPGLDDKTHPVRSVLQRMGRKSRPTSVTYRQAIQTVAATRGTAELKKEALQLAMEIYQDRKHLPPKQRDYMKLHTTMLEACGKLSPRGIHGDQVVEQVFDACRREGVVTSLHTSLLQKAASDELIKRILNTEHVDPHAFQSIPSSWSRNTQRKRTRVK